MGKGEAFKDSIVHAIFSWRTWLAAVLTVCGLVFVIALALDPHPVSAAKTAISVASSASVVFVSTPLWRLVWLLPGVARRLPLLDGRWSGAQQSNWPVIAAMKDGAKAAGRGLDVDNAASRLPDLLQTPVGAEITCTFFNIRMELTSSVTRYQNSILKAAVLTPATEQARGKLTYVFEGRVPRPRSTDVDRFDGAAELEIRPASDGGLVLAGPTWTNRNWAKGLNTAGIIELKRDENWSAPVWLRRGRAAA